MKSIALLLLALMAVPSVSAEGWDFSCSDADHLFKNTTILTSTSSIEINQTIFCEHGCGSDIYGNANCKPSPFGRYAILGAIGIGVMALALYLSRKIG